MGYQCKNPFVCCLFILFYIFVFSRLFPLPPDLSTFKGYCTTFADEQRKGANDGIGKLIISQIDDRPNSNITLQ